MVRGVKIYVDSLMFPWATSFYLQGLVDLFGKQRIGFSDRFFTDLPKDSFRPNTFNFVVYNNGRITKYAIDWFDANKINNMKAYEWCDVYGKVNTNWLVTPKHEFPKLESVPPSMGIKFNSLLGSIKNWLLNSCKAGIVLSNDFLKYARYYYREYNRLPVSCYCYSPEKVENGYVFFLNTLWYDASWNNNDDALNTPRYNLMKWISELPFTTFEGGFVAHNSRNNKHGYISSSNKFELFLTNKKIGIEDYLNKLKKSYVAINTGGVVSCFGWKLAEYLALGKAIVSLPIVNDLSIPLEHGKNIHFVDCKKESISEALTYIYENPDYRKELEQGSRRYWDAYCRPDKVLSNLMEDK